MDIYKEDKERWRECMEKKEQDEKNRVKSTEQNNSDPSRGGITHRFIFFHRAWLLNLLEKSSKIYLSIVISDKSLIYGLCPVVIKNMKFPFSGWNHVSTARRQKYT